MSNLVKSAFVVQKDADRVIDSNQLIAEHMQKLQERMEEELSAVEASYEEDFVEGLDAEQVEQLMADRDAEASASELDSVKAELEEAVLQLENTRAQTEALLADTKERCNAMLEEAQIGADKLFQEASSNGHDEGYNAGYLEGLQKAKDAEDKVREREVRLVRTYEEKLSEMEPLLVENICAIYEEVFGVDFSGRSSVVLYLLHKAIGETEGSSNYLVHVSTADYAYVSEHKDELLAGKGTSATLELISDQTLSQGACYIESDGGIFDCSLGVEMEALQKELRLLSRSDE